MFSLADTACGPGYISAYTVLKCVVDSVPGGHFGSLNLKILGKLNDTRKQAFRSICKGAESFLGPEGNPNKDGRLTEVLGLLRGITVNVKRHEGDGINEWRAKQLDAIREAILSIDEYETLTQTARIDGVTGKSNQLGAISDAILSTGEYRTLTQTAKSRVLTSQSKRTTTFGSPIFRLSDEFKLVTAGLKGKRGNWKKTAKEFMALLPILLDAMALAERDERVRDDRSMARWYHYFASTLPADPHAEGSGEDEDYTRLLPQAGEMVSNKGGDDMGTLPPFDGMGPGGLFGDTYEPPKTATTTTGEDLLPPLPDWDPAV